MPIDRVLFRMAIGISAHGHIDTLLIGLSLIHIYEVLIHKNSSFVGTGHNSEIVTDKVGNDWVFYHRCV